MHSLLGDYHHCHMSCALECRDLIMMLSRTPRFKTLKPERAILDTKPSVPVGDESEAHAMKNSYDFVSFRSSAYRAQHLSMSIL